jgi:hypothetical protein
MSKSKAMHDWQSRVAELGCIACEKIGYHGTPAELHHIRETAGGGQKSGDDEVVPLCPAHHRGTMHPLTPSIHLDRRVFIEQFGSEVELLAEVKRRLA